MKVGTVETRHLRGLTEKAIGLGKEAVGTFVGNERLTDEGKAQQRKAGEQLDALRKQAKAQAKEAKAEGAEQRQRAAQHVKEERQSA